MPQTLHSSICQLNITFLTPNLSSSISQNLPLITPQNLTLLVRLYFTKNLNWKFCISPIAKSTSISSLPVLLPFPNADFTYGLVCPYMEYVFQSYVGFTCTELHNRMTSKAIHLTSKSSINDLFFFISHNPPLFCIFRYFLPSSSWLLF